MALLKRLRGAADWFGSLAGQALAGRAEALDIGTRPLRLVDGTVLTAPGSEGADWRLYMGYDPVGCRFTDFELTDGNGAERLERFPAVAQEIRIADRGFGHRALRLARAGRGAGRRSRAGPLARAALA